MKLDSIINNTVMRKGISKNVISKFNSFILSAAAWAAWADEAAVDERPLKTRVSFLLFVRNKRNDLDLDLHFHKVRLEYSNQNFEGKKSRSSKTICLLQVTQDVLMSLLLEEPI
jgi:hypothetical protein